MKKKNSLFWFRRDLRIQDNAGLYHALNGSDSVACMFVLDTTILFELGSYDTRIDFLWHTLNNLKEELRALGSDLIIVEGDPKDVVPKLAKKYKVDTVYCNEDYEPKARQRDKNVADLLKEKKIAFFSLKDQVIFAKDEVLSAQGRPYSGFTHYANAWKKKFKMEEIEEYECEHTYDKFAQFKSQDLPTLKSMGFEETHVSKSKIGFSHAEAKKLLQSFVSKRIKQYKKGRDFPSLSGVSYLSVHNRFGTLSIRELFRAALKVRTNDAEVKENIDTWINELIWREFYFQILYNFPRVAYEPFNSEYKNFPWENDMEKFQKWCDGETGYPIVDAAMHQLNQTGYMHNRLRMVTASFLTKHLLVDYRLGEQYFAAKLLDYDLSANNGGWQWAASTGCDSQPYFRVFNPILQSEKFDPEAKFIKKMLPIFASIEPKYIHNPSEYRKELEELGFILGEDYPEPIVNHKEARQHTLELFKDFIANNI